MMMKKLFILIAVICLLLVGCETTEVDNPDGDFFSRFIIVEKYVNSEDGMFYVTYDKDTMVMYYIINHDRGLAMSPIYNADGTVRKYGGNR